MSLRTNYRRISPEQISGTPFSRAGHLTTPAWQGFHEILIFRVTGFCRVTFRFHSQRSTIMRLRSPAGLVGGEIFEMVVAAGGTSCSLPILTRAANIQEEFVVEIEGIWAETEQNELFWEIYGDWMGQVGEIKIEQRNPLDLVTGDVIIARTRRTIPADVSVKSEEDENVRIEGMVETFRENDEDESSKQ